MLTPCPLLLSLQGPVGPAGGPGFPGAPGAKVGDLLVKLTFSEGQNSLPVVPAKGSSATHLLPLASLGVSRVSH